jgi:hypothetical protein
LLGAGKVIAKRGAATKKRKAMAAAARGSGTTTTQPASPGAPAPAPAALAAAALAGYVPASFGAASKLAPLTGRRFESRAAAYWAEAGALLSPAERESFVSWVRDDHLPFTTVPAQPIGFRADGWLGQYIVVYPELGLVGVRRHREPVEETVHCYVEHSALRDE